MAAGDNYEPIQAATSGGETRAKLFVADNSTNPRQWIPFTGGGLALASASFQASSAVTVGSTIASPITGLSQFSKMTLTLAVTSTGGSGQLLDVWAQRLLGDGATWDTIGRFAQVGASAQVRVMDIYANSAISATRVADTSTSVAGIGLAAATTRDVLWNDQVRIVGQVTATAAPLFVWGVSGYFKS